MIHDAARIIKREHDSLAAVLHALLYLVEQINKGRWQPDFELLRTMLRYVDDFPEKLHHPKEDSHLFSALRMRAPEAGPVLGELEAEHREGVQRMHELNDALKSYEQHGAGGYHAFADAVRRYVDFEWQHMRKEDEVLLPLAEQKLTATDWRTIDTAFKANTDPLSGATPDDEMDALFHRIAALAPAPIGWNLPMRSRKMPE